jgi:hypothetical protein
VVKWWVLERQDLKGERRELKDLSGREVRRCLCERQVEGKVCENSDLEALGEAEESASVCEALVSGCGCRPE